MDLKNQNCIRVIREDPWPILLSHEELRTNLECLICSGHARAKEERVFMGFSTAGGGPSRPEMNVTPLIDILLVLIIVFMVIVVTSKEYVVNTQLPEEAKGEQSHQNERTIVIQIIWSQQQKAPLLKINQESVPWDDLEPKLARIFLSRAEKLAYVKGDNDLDFEYVAQVIAEAHNAGITRVGLLTKDLDGE